MGLGDGEVLVVALVGDQRRRADRVDPRQVESQQVAILVAPASRRGSGPHLEVDPVGLVEAPRTGLPRSSSVERVQVEARRARLLELLHADVITERDLRLVEREVVIDELAEIGEPGRDRPRPAVRGRHRLGDLAPHGEADGAAGGTDAGEPEGRHGGQRRARAPGHGELGRVGAHHAFTDDEIGVPRVTLHGSLQG